MDARTAETGGILSPDDACIKGFEDAGRMMEWVRAIIAQYKAAFLSARTTAEKAEAYGGFVKLMLERGYDHELPSRLIDCR
jgi:hypothetical protein